MVQGLLKHLGDGLLGFKKLHSEDGLSQVGVKLQQEFTFSLGERTLAGGPIEPNVSHEALV